MLDKAKNMIQNSGMKNMIFMIIVVIIIVIVIYYLMSLFSFTGETAVVSGSIDAKHGKVVEQDPNVHGSRPILRSNNRTTGLEFTWSVWVNIDHMDYLPGKEKLIFNKGSSQSNCPGLYIDKNTNNFIVRVDNFNGGKEEIVIKDFTLNKWINVIIRCENLYLDVYINGTIVKRHVCSYLPKQNYSNVNVATGGGFSGKLSDLYYWNYALGTSKIESIIELGPGLMEYDPHSIYDKGSSIWDWFRNLFSSHKGSSNIPTAGVPGYYSLRWFLGNDDSSTTSLDYGGL